MSPHKNYLNINESFICKIWEGGVAYYKDLITTDGLSVDILDYGERNFDGGPDYRDCKVNIGDKIYSGDIEIHKDFQSWKQHKHKNDKKYNSVILQVILWRKGLFTKPQVSKKRNIPTVILSDFLTASIHDIWKDIIGSPSTGFHLPCANLNSLIHDEVILHFIHKLSLERLNMKTKRMNERLREIIHSETGEYDYIKCIRKSKYWERLLIDFIFEALGYSKNKEQMLKLSNLINIGKLKKLVKDTEDEELLVQSQLFGYAGFLNDIRIKDEYLIKLKELWSEYKQNRNISGMNKSEWQFFRLRPQNFPTLRIAYASKIILKVINDEFLKQLVEKFKSYKTNTIILYKNIKNLFRTEADNYWSYHYNFGKSSKKRSNLIGEQRIREITTNVIIPFMNLYSKVFQDRDLQNTLIRFYSECRMKFTNNIINKMSEQILNNRSIKINTPQLEQGLIQLYNFYCLRQRCKICDIGKRIFKEEGIQYNIIFY